LQTITIDLVPLTHFSYRFSALHYIISLHYIASFALHFIIAPYFISEVTAVGNVIIEIVLERAEKSSDGKILDEGRQEKFKVLSVAAM
jgi:hypothetical protein